MTPDQSAVLLRLAWMVPAAYVGIFLFSCLMGLALAFLTGLMEGRGTADDDEHFS